MRRRLCVPSLSYDSIDVPPRRRVRNYHRRGSLAAEAVHIDVYKDRFQREQTADNGPLGPIGRTRIRSPCVYAFDSSRTTPRRSVPLALIKSAASDKLSFEDLPRCAIRMIASMFDKMESEVGIVSRSGRFVMMLS